MKISFYVLEIALRTLLGRRFLLSKEVFLFFIFVFYSISIQTFISVNNSNLVSIQFDLKAIEVNSLDYKMSCAV